jgi:hypothetical protein
VSVAGPALPSFLSLAHSLGISGFAAPPTPSATPEADKTPTKRKLEWGQPPPPPAGPLTPLYMNAAEAKLESLKSETLRLLSQPATPVKKTGSEPASLADTVLQCSASKKRKLQTQSLTDNVENMSPNLFLLPPGRLHPPPPYSSACRQHGHLSTACRSATDPLPPTPSRAGLSVMAAPCGGSYPSSPSREGGGPVHAPSTSCPVPPSPAYSGAASGPTQSAHSSNFR